MAEEKAQTTPASLTWFRTINRSKTHSPAAADKVMLQVNLALEKLKNSAIPASDKTQYGLLAECLITANVRIEEILLNDVSQIDAANQARTLINAGLKALIRAYDRKERLGRWGFDGPGLTDISDAISVYEEIMRNSSPKQMDRARDAAIKRNRKAYQRENQR